MESKSSVFSLAFLSFFLLFSSATAFNITRLLEPFSEFSSFNALLTQTKLDKEINHRQTITVLAVPNGAISGISGKPADVLKRIMSLHVVLDYYDSQKLHKLSKKTALLTTLFQSSGEAIGRLGFLNVTISPEGAIYFGSAVRGSAINSKYVESVTAKPYNISVLHISAAIDPESIETLQLPNSTALPPKASVPVGAPKPAKSKSPVEAPEPSVDEAEAPVADAPADSPADAPADAPAPEASDVPAKSPPAPTPDADAAEAPKSGVERVSFGSFVGVAVMGVASWFVM